MPISTATALIGSALIGGAASASAASKAAKAQTNAANQATQVAEDHYNQVRSDLLPYNTQGQQSLADATKFAAGYGDSAAGQSTGYTNKLITGAGGSQQAALRQTPGYQFTLSQGLKALGNQNATRLGGAFAKGAANFATQGANATYGDQVNRSIQNTQVQNQAFNDQFNRLYSPVAVGENAAAQTGSLGVQTASSVGNNLTSAGNATAANQIAAGNAIGNAASSIPAALIYNQLFKDQSANAAATSGMYGRLPSPLAYSSSSIPGGLFGGN